MGDVATCHSLATLLPLYCGASPAHLYAQPASTGLEDQPAHEGPEG